MARVSNRVEIDGHVFLSESEGEFYLKIKKAKENGVILDFILAPKYELQPSFKNWEGKKVESIDHYPDFMITRLDKTNYIVDTKGGSFHETDAKIKRKIWLYQNPNIPYYYASTSPKYLGGNWLETTTNSNFLIKLTNVYKKEIYPNCGKITAKSPSITKSQVDEYFIWEDMDGLFYRMIKKYTKAERIKLAKLKEKEKNKWIILNQ